MLKMTLFTLVFFFNISTYAQTCEHLFTNSVVLKSNSNLIVFRYLAEVFKSKYRTRDHLDSKVEYEAVVLAYFKASLENKVSGAETKITLSKTLINGYKQRQESYVEIVGSEKEGVKGIRFSQIPYLSFEGIGRSSGALVKRVGNNLLIQVTRSSESSSKIHYLTYLFAMDDTGKIISIDFLLKTTQKSDGEIQLILNYAFTR